MPARITNEVESGSRRRREALAILQPYAEIEYIATDEERHYRSPRLFRKGSSPLQALAAGFGSGLMGLFAALRRHDEKATADTLYRLIVAQSRQPMFYEELGVPDTPDGRYDVLMAHVVLVLRRLNRGQSRTKKLAQALFDLMFADMDQNLREMGVGDLAVGKRVKGMAKAFYGRLAAYDAALSRGDAAALKSALIRNLFRKTMPTDAQVAAVAAYLQQEAARLDLEPLQALTSGHLSFGLASIASLEDSK